METIGQRFQRMKNGIPSTQSASESSNSPSQTEPDYWAAYDEPGNPIRAYTESMGVQAITGEDGVRRFAIDPDALTGEDVVYNGVPGIWQGRRFEHFRPEYYSPANQAEARKILDAAQHYVANFAEYKQQHKGCGLYIWSKEKGSGKTMLASILGNALAATKQRVRWYSMAALLGDIKATFDDKDGNSARNILERVQRSDVLILDDIGSEKVSDWVNETIFSIVDERLKCCRPTVYTSNFAPEKLPYDGRTVDRIEAGTLALHLPEERVRRLLASVSKDVLRKELGL